MYSCKEEEAMARAVCSGVRGTGQFAMLAVRALPDPTGGLVGLRLGRDEVR